MPICSCCRQRQGRLRSHPHPARAAGAASSPLDALYAQLAQLRGTVALKVEPSLVAGLAMEGSAGLKVEGATPGPGIASADVALRSGSNRVEAALRTRADRPAADRLDVTIDAPRLGELASVARQFGLSTAPASAGGPPASAAARSFGGSVVGKAQVIGRWPAVSSEGRLQASAVQLPDLRLDRGAVDWKLGTSADSPLALKADLTGMAAAGASVDRATVDLSGTAREHRLDLSAESKVLPPEWTDKLTGAQPASATCRASPCCRFCWRHGAHQRARAGERRTARCHRRQRARFGTVGQRMARADR